MGYMTKASPGPGIGFGPRPGPAWWGTPTTSIPGARPNVFPANFNAPPRGPGPMAPLRAPLRAPVGLGTAPLVGRLPAAVRIPLFWTPAARGLLITLALLQLGSSVIGATQTALAKRGLLHNLMRIEGGELKWIGSRQTQAAPLTVDPSPAFRNTQHWTYSPNGWWWRVWVAPQNYLIGGNQFHTNVCVINPGGALLNGIPISAYGPARPMPVPNTQPYAPATTPRPVYAPPEWELNPDPGSNPWAPPRPRVRPRTRPSRRPDTSRGVDVSFPPSQLPRSRATPPRGRVTRPPKGTKETKKYNPRTAGGAILGLVNLLTESMDWLEVIYKASGGTRSWSPQAQFEWLFVEGNIVNFDLRTFAVEAVKMEFQDQVIGRMSQRVAQASLDWKLGHGLEIGPWDSGVSFFN